MQEHGSVHEQVIKVNLLTLVLIHAAAFNHSDLNATSGTYVNAEFWARVLYSRAEWTKPRSEFLAVVSGLGVSYNFTLLIKAILQFLD